MTRNPRTLARKATALVAIISLLCGPSAQAALIAGWDFQTTTNGGTAVAASPNTPKLYVANFGTGTLYLNGSEGSSNWFVPASGSTNTELNGFGGSTVNAGVGFSTTTSGAAALALVGGSSGTAANGKMAVFKFSMAGYQDLVISLAAQRTSTGFSTQVWEYSTDGSSYSSVGSLVSGSTAGTITGTFGPSGVLSLPTVSGLNNASTAYLRVTFTGATASSGNNRLDNIQFNASTYSPPSANYTWTGSGSGGTWANGSAGSFGTNYSNGLSSEVTFSGVGETVTLDGAIQAGKVIFSPSSGSYTLSGGTSLELGVGNNVQVSDGATATISSIITGSSGLTKALAGTVVLGGANTFTGGVTVSQGTVQVAADSAFGDAANDISNLGTLKVTTGFTLGAGRDVTGGGTLDIAAGQTLTVAGAYNAGTTLSNTGVLDLQNATTRNVNGLTFTAAGTVNAAGPISASGLTASALASGTATVTPAILFTTGDKTVNVGTGGTLLLSGSVSLATNAGTEFTKEGAGTLILSGSGSSISRMQIGRAASSPTNGGVLRVADAGGLGAQEMYFNWGTIEPTVAITTPIGISLSGRSASKTVIGGAGGNEAVTFEGGIRFYGPNGTSGDIVLDVNNETTFSGIVTGSTSATITGLTVGGTGRLALTADNTATMTLPVTLADTVTLELGNAGALGGSTLDVSAGSVNFTTATAALGGLAGSGNIVLPTTSLTIGGNGASTTYSGDFSGSGKAVKIGGGTLTLSGSNDHSGGVDIDAGVLAIAADAALGSGNVALGGGTLSATETFTLGSARVVTVSGTSGFDVAATKTVTFDGDFTGTGRLNKGGLGQLTLGGTSAGYTGTFAINAGTVELTNADALDNAVILQTGGALILAPTSGTVVPLPGLEGDGGEVSIGNGKKVAVGDNTDRTYGGRIRGQGGFRKQGNGRLELTGDNDFAGNTVVDSGRLVINGSLSATPLVTVALGAEIGGSGSIGGTLAGAGAVGPGNSPGIFAAPTTDPSGGLDYNFEFSGLSPVYSDASASVNDVLRLTDTATPFLANLGAGNVVNVYLPSSLADGQTYRGGFFLDATVAQVGSFLDAIDSATFNYFVQDNAGGVSYGGLNYRTLGDWNTANSRDISLSVGTSTVATADFAGGTVSNGQVMQFVAVPEPSALALAGFGVVAAGFAAWRRRRMA